MNKLKSPRVKLAIQLVTLLHFHCEVFAIRSNVSELTVEKSDRKPETDFISQGNELGQVTKESTVNKIFNVGKLSVNSLKTLQTSGNYETLRTSDIHSEVTKGTYA